MKYRHVVPMLAAIALALILSGCGKDSPTGVTPPDETAPAAPAQVSMSFNPATGENTLDWTPSSSASVTGYQVFLYEPSPERENAYSLKATTDANTTSYVLPVVSTTVQQIYRVRTVAGNGTRSGWSTLANVTLTPPRVGEGTKEPIPQRPTDGQD